MPDYPPQEHLLPPAPTSPTVQVAPFDTAPLPVSPVDLAADGPAASIRQERLRGPLAPPSDPAHPAAAAAAQAPVQPAAPAAPVVGQPRFSVPGLEHVLVEGTEPEPSGPIGYRTPARFARQQAPRPTVVESAPTPFDAVIAPPASALTDAAAPLSTEVFPGVGGGAAAGAPAPAPSIGGRVTAADVPTPGAASGSSETAAGGSDGAGSDLPTERRERRDRGRSAIGATPAAALGAVTAVGTLGLAAWWFTAPAAVHVTGLVLGVLALVFSCAALRHPATTWQRPLGLLGAVLGGVGTLVLLWAVAAALLPLAGVTLPDLTGTGTTPTLAP
ncbi:hypothetical protein [Curtobacterium sp. MCSS17_007]|uniref:hypothetical protein n=1 Tax=Curtobacterium sp. MCSS17_007 TaxID=2175646 RepID=UPI0011B68FA1|nr:hypothetical protein [Curtobacterium sp. MCSS17_007]WIE76798.1 hypothetical protein DEJ22_005935 [Curtobacterium sp. MCSS17_007]